MTDDKFEINGREFSTYSEYRKGLRDKELIDRLNRDYVDCGQHELKSLLEEVKRGKYSFQTGLGKDFEEDLRERCQRRCEEAKLDTYIEQALVKREKRRKLIILMGILLAVICFGYFGIYSYYDYRTSNRNDEFRQAKEEALNKMKKDLFVPEKDEDEPFQPTIINRDGEAETREVLEEYKNLLNKNKKLIGWLKIDDTNIDYPVMQTSDNDYYQDHNLNQEYDKNGSIFMDMSCDVLKPSTNYILYGHHMKNGQMFGHLDKYEDSKYGEEHPYIQFDTIYEKGLYQVMYVFRSRVYNEDEIIFKYYQFIDANSEMEFDSYMQEMSDMSLYDTGVTASYGDHLLTLSTCDYQEKNGRFVVVAKKVLAKE